MAEAEVFPRLTDGLDGRRQNCLHRVPSCWDANAHHADEPKKVRYILDGEMLARTTLFEDFSPIRFDGTEKILNSVVILTSIGHRL